MAEKTLNDQVTMLETEFITKNANEALARARAGDFVEMGCYKGETSVLLGRICRNKCKLYLYDSFAGLPEKSGADLSVAGENFKKGELLASKTELVRKFKSASLPLPVIKKGFFDELSPEDLPSKIAFAFLDGDLYESIKDSLKLVVPKMVDGGTILVHDYINTALPGAAKAVDEYLANIKKHSEISVKSVVFQSIIKLTISKH